MPFEADGGDDEEVGDCMVDIFGVCEGNKVVAELINADVAVAEDDPDWLLAMLKYADIAASALLTLTQKKKISDRLRSNL